MAILWGGDEVTCAVACGQALRAGGRVGAGREGVQGLCGGPGGWRARWSGYGSEGRGVQR
jgi:hypothetical protein